LTIYGESELYPLFEVRDLPTPYDISGDTRRYSDRENSYGGDGWGRKSTIAWLKRNANFKFNDINAIHGARYYNDGTKLYRSILGHSKHFRGREIDIRYANPIAGLGSVDNISLATDNLSITMASFAFDNNTYNGYSRGSGIKTLSENARIAYFDNNDAVKTNYHIWRDWIRTNRALMEMATSDITAFFGFDLVPENIFFSNDATINNMLESGKFDDGSIESNMLAENRIGSWTWPATQNDRVKMLPSHNDHWHIDTPDF
jgi:hypothetical protein